MNKQLLHQNGFARTTLLTTVTDSKFVDPHDSRPRARLIVQHYKIGQFTMHSMCLKHLNKCLNNNCSIYMRCALIIVIYTMKNFL